MGMTKGLIMVIGLALPLPVIAQLLPGTPLGGATQAVPDILDGVDRTLDRTNLDRLSPSRLADRLLAARSARIADLLRRHGDAIELDDRRQPARRGVILLTGADAAALDALREAGYMVEQSRIDGLDLPVTGLTAPKGKNLAAALREVRALAPSAQASADNLYFPSGASAPQIGHALATGTGAGGQAIGVIDGGVANHPTLTASVEQQGFARGAPRASAHGTAIASLISGTGTIKGAAPGAPLLVADVYGNDRAGGGAFAIARALGWMAARRTPVVTVSLVGPDNPLLAGAIKLARERGLTVVAAIGNDGPAAPPAFPASYPGVVAVTGVDGRNRPLPEAGKAAHLDFAAPGADMDAARADGGRGPVRGTSFAAPLVAGRLARAGSLTALEREAQDLGDKGRDARFGNGLICGKCRNTR